MARKTIAQLRETQVEKLAAMHDGNLDAARKIMNSYYRMCGLCETNLYLANDEQIYNPRTLAASEAREEKWYNRLNKALAPYNLELVYFGYHPTICYKGENRQAINIYFYE